MSVVASFARKILQRNSTQLLINIKKVKLIVFNKKRALWWKECGALEHKNCKLTVAHWAVIAWFVQKKFSKIDSKPKILHLDENWDENQWLFLMDKNGQNWPVWCKKTKSLFEPLSICNTILSTTFVFFFVKLCGVKARGETETLSRTVHSAANQCISLQIL